MSNRNIFFIKEIFIFPKIVTYSILWEFEFKIFEHFLNCVGGADMRGRIQNSRKYKALAGLRLNSEIIGNFRNFRKNFGSFPTN